MFNSIHVLKLSEENLSYVRLYACHSVCYTIGAYPNGFGDMRTYRLLVNYDVPGFKAARASGFLEFTSFFTNWFMQKNVKTNYLHKMNQEHSHDKST